MYTTKPLIEHLRTIPDSRCGRTCKHDHAQVLLCLICGYLAGRCTIRRSLDWCRNHLEELQKYIPLKNGVASPATACRILCGIDEKLFLYAFILKTEKWLLRSAYGRYKIKRKVHINIENIGYFRHKTS